MTKQNQNQKKHAWVIVNKDNPQKIMFLNRTKKSQYTSKIENALLFPTRVSARGNKNEIETVCKVTLNEKNKPIQIVCGNGGGY